MAEYQNLFTQVQVTGPRKWVCRCRGNRAHRREAASCT
jgi:hypothetical protein